MVNCSSCARYVSYIVSSSAELCSSDIRADRQPVRLREKSQMQARPDPAGGDAN